MVGVVGGLTRNRSTGLLMFPHSAHRLRLFLRNLPRMIAFAAAENDGPPASDLKHCHHRRHMGIVVYWVRRFAVFRGYKNIQADVLQLAGLPENGQCWNAAQMAWITTSLPSRTGSFQEAGELEYVA